MFSHCHETNSVLQLAKARKDRLGSNLESMGKVAKQGEACELAIEKQSALLTKLFEQHGIVSCLSTDACYHICNTRAAAAGLSFDSIRAQVQELGEFDEEVQRADDSVVSASGRK